MPEFETTAQGCRLATSIGGVLTGRGADLIIIDDPLKPEEALSETQRRAANEWFDHTLYSRLNDKLEGAIVLIMHRRAPSRNHREEHNPPLGHVPMRKLTAVHAETLEAELQREGWVTRRRQPKKVEDAEPAQPEKQGLSAQNRTTRPAHAFTGAQSWCAARGTAYEPCCTGEAAETGAERNQDPRQGRDRRGVEGGQGHAALSARSGRGNYRAATGRIARLALVRSPLERPNVTVNQSLERIKSKVTFKAPKTKTS